MDFSVQAHIVEDGPPLQKKIVLRHIGEMTARFAKRAAIYFYPSFIPFQDTGQNVEDRGFAAAGRAEDRDKFSVVHIKRNVIQYGAAVKGEAQMFYFQLH